MDENIRTVIEARACRAIDERVFPGCVIGLIRANGSRMTIPVGTLRYQAIEYVREDTIYDLASITKSIPIASLALLMIAEGKMRLSDTVKTYLPEFQNDFGATIEDLMRYRVRGARMAHLRYTTFEEIRTHIFEHGFDGPPGESAYTNLPAFLLGIIVERIGGASLPVLTHKNFFEPLEMDDTTFFPHDLERVAPTEIANDEEIRGIVHDESARLFARRRRTVGHAGLFSTVPNLLNFLQTLQKRTYPMVVEGAEQGLGWQVSELWMGRKRGEKTFGKTGFTGTSMVCDIERGIGLVILSNRTYPKRPETDEAIFQFRTDIADIVFT